MSENQKYLMENPQEIYRLELKTDPKEIRREALWCGLKSGMRILDAACGPGKITAILHEMIQPNGEIIGLDSSEERIQYAKRTYGNKPGIDFRVQDLKKSIENVGKFDLIWVRFILEYFRVESADIVKNLAFHLKPGGRLCLIDLDNNCLGHYKLPKKMEDILVELISLLEDKYDFDPYVGRKLYSYLYDLNYEDIQLDMTPHHLIYGEVSDEDMFNWIKKVEVVSSKERWMFESYQGEHKGFFNDFKKFFQNPRRFTYTPMILCKGKKPA